MGNSIFSPPSLPPSSPIFMFGLGSKPDVSEVLKWLKDLNDWFSVGMKVGTS